MVFFGNYRMGADDVLAIDTIVDTATLSLVIAGILSPFILVIHESFSYTCPENECAKLSALRKTVKPATCRRRRRLLLAGTSKPAPAAPRHGSPGGSQQGYQPDAAAGESAAHFGGTADVQFGAGTAGVF